MKRVILTLAISAAFGALAFAGGEQYSAKDKEIAPVAPECWYRAQEWDVSIWGTYAFPANDGDSDQGRPEIPRALAQPAISSFDFDLGTEHDNLFDKDHAFGGGLDVKYFPSKYWGLGAEGFILGTPNTTGAALGTFTFRYPIQCSRYAPYGFMGGGVLEGGSRTDRFVVDDRDEFIHDQTHLNTHAEGIYQIGAGLEIRITKPTQMSKIAVGLMADFAWNVVSGPENNFGMVRSGLNFSY